MDSASYHGVLLEKSTAKSWRRDKIVVCLQDKRFNFPVGAFKAELLQLTIATKYPRKRLGHLVNILFTSE